MWVCQVEHDHVMLPFTSPTLYIILELNVCRGRHWTGRYEVVFLHTLSVKRNITSSERHSPKLQSIRMNHILLQISYNTPYQAHLKNVCLSKKGIKCREIARGNFSKITEIGLLPGSEFAQTKADATVA